jgi:WD40 repeat protein
MDRHSADITNRQGAPVSAGGTARPTAPKRSFASRLFGYDIFLSFALGPPPRGTHSYASDLARRLRERDFSVFFSEDEAPPGDQLDSTLRNALLRSKTLAVIANRGTLQEPRWVQKEVEEFRKYHPDRPVITINVGGALQDPMLAESAQKWLGYEGKIWLDESEEAVTTGIASNPVAERLATAPARAKSNVKWRWVRNGAIVVLAALAIGLGIAAKIANDQRDRAINALGRIFSERAWQHLDRGDRFLAVKYALAGWRIAPSTEADHRLVLASILQEANENLAVMVHSAQPVSTVFSPNGNLIATTCEDGEVRLWDSRSGKQVRVFSGHELKTNSAVFSSDGKTVASASEDGTVRLWDSTSGREVRPFLDHPLPVRLASFNPDAQQVVTIAEMRSLSREAQEISLWNVNGGGAIWTVSSTEDVLTVSFTPDGKGVVTVNASGTAQFWDRLSGRQYGHRSFGDRREATAAALNLAHDLLVLAYDDGVGKAFRFSTGTPLADFHGHKSAILDIHIAQSGDRVVTGGADGSARIWDLYSGRALALLMGHQRAVVRVAFSEDGKRVTTASNDGTVRVWTAGRMVAQLGRDGEVAMAFSPDRTRLAVVSAAKLQLYDVPTFRRVAQVELPAGTTESRRSEAVSFTGDLGRVLLADSNGEITSREVGTGPPVLVHRSTGQLFAVALASGAPLAAFVSFDAPTEVQLVNTTTGQQVTLPGEAEGVVGALSFSHDGSRLVAASQDGWVNVWNTTTGQPIRLSQGEPSPSGQAFFKVFGSRLNAVKLSDDGELVAFALSDGTARVMNVGLKREISVLRPQKELVVSIAFSPDSSLVITGGADGARIWDVRTGRQLAAFSKPTANVAFTPDGRFIVAGGGSFFSRVAEQRFESKTTEVWDIARLSQPMQELAAATCRNFLSPAMHRFNEIELTADPLIGEIWLAGEQKERSVCE